MTSTLTAVDLVVATTELLENILLHSTPLTVLRAKAASRRMNDLINASLPLQQKLFFKADFADQPHAYGIAPNPLLDDLATNPDEHHFALVHDRGAPCILPLNAQTGACGVALKLSAIPKPGSCVDMFVTQPPMTHLGIFCGHPKRIRGIPKMDKMMDHYGDVYSENGIRWRDVCNALVKKGWPCAEKGTKIEQAATMPHLRL